MEQSDLNNYFNEEELMYAFNDVVESANSILIAKTCPAGYGNYYGQCCKGQGLNNLTCI